MSTQQAPSPQPEFAIRVQDVSKTFKVKTVQRSGTGRSFSMSGGVEERRALCHVSFDVRRGETVGIIGHNGAGKSTLLKMITGIMQPDSGQIHINGEVTPIIGLAAGFSPQLSGLENIYLKGAAMGMNDKEVDARIDEICEFSEIEYALQRPLRTYSSGMMMRLAFSVAFLRIPDVLIVDETLAVGDEVFRRKCMGRIAEIKDAGSTIVLVSHGTAMMRSFCNRLLLMDEGEGLFFGAPDKALQAYQRLCYATAGDRGEIREQVRAGQVDVPLERKTPPAGHAGQSGGAGAGTARLKPRERARSNGAVIARGSFVNAPAGRPAGQTEPGGRVNVEFMTRFQRPARDVYLRVGVTNSDGIELGSFNLSPDGEGEGLVEGGQKVGFSARIAVPLLPGSYFLTADLFGHVGDNNLCLHGLGDLDVLEVAGSEASGGGTVFFDPGPVPG